jgi:hypothetical protein
MIIFVGSDFEICTFSSKMLSAVGDGIKKF